MGDTVRKLCQKSCGLCGIWKIVIYISIHLLIYRSLLQESKYLISFWNIGTTTTCADDAGFKDSYNVTCAQYKEWEYCKDGKPDIYSGNSLESLKKMSNDQGVSAVDACCVCGGGQEGMWDFL